MRDAQHEDEQNQKEELKKVLDNPPNSLTYFKEEPVTENQRQAEKERVKQRWKILCLVKTSDRAGDKHLKQEKLKERVDEWMSSMVNQMRLVEETHEQQQNGNIPDDKGELDLSSNNSGDRATSPLVPNYKDELVRLRKVSEAEQQKRIQAREELELERERLLVLEGKMKVKEEHLKDPILKLHFDCLKMEKRAKNATAKKLKRKQRKEKTKAIKLKWTSAKDKLKLKNFSLPNACSVETETVVANLVYDELKTLCTRPKTVKLHCWMVKKVPVQAKPRKVLIPTLSFKLLMTLRTLMICIELLKFMLVLHLIMISRLNVHKV